MWLRSMPHDEDKQGGARIQLCALSLTVDLSKLKLSSPPPVNPPARRRISQLLRCLQPLPCSSLCPFSCRDSALVHASFFSVIHLLSLSAHLSSCSHAPALRTHGLSDAPLGIECRAQFGSSARRSPSCVCTRRLLLLPSRAVLSSRSVRLYTLNSGEYAHIERHHF